MCIVVLKARNSAFSNWIANFIFIFAVHDPDPLMTTLSRRKRRSSWESGTSDGSRATKTPRASIDEPSPSPSQHHQSSLQAPKSRIHSGDLKMRINVSQSKQKKASTTTTSTMMSSSNGQQPQNSSSVGTAAKVVRKSAGALAQRPSISSVSVSVSAIDDVAGNFYGLCREPDTNW